MSSLQAQELFLREIDCGNTGIIDLLEPDDIRVPIVTLGGGHDCAGFLEPVRLGPLDAHLITFLELALRTSRRRGWRCLRDGGLARHHFNSTGAESRLRIHLSLVSEGVSVNVPIASRLCSHINI